MAFLSFTAEGVCYKPFWFYPWPFYLSAGTFFIGYSATRDLRTHLRTQHWNYYGKKPTEIRARALDRHVFDCYWWEYKLSCYLLALELIINLGLSWPWLNVHCSGGRWVFSSFFSMGYNLLPVLSVVKNCHGIR